MGSKRIRIVVALAVVLAAVALAVPDLTGRSGPDPVSEVVSPEYPLGRPVLITGVVVSSAYRHGMLVVSLADRAEPKRALLRVEYTGRQRVTFGEGSVVLVRGVLQRRGVFRATGFLTKATAPRERVG